MLHDAATITNSTINNNKTGVFGGGIGLNASARLTMTNSTISGNQVTTDTLSGDPLTGPLQDNTGPTLTHALLDGSKAIDFIPPGINECDIAIKDDPRGYTCPALKGCDIGAIERGLMFYQPIIFKE